MYNIDTQENVAVHMCGFDGVRRGNYFGEEPFGKAEVDVRVGKPKNGNEEEVTGDMIKGWSENVGDWI